MMGKYLEIKTGRSLRMIKSELWQVHEAHICDEKTGQLHVLQMDAGDFVNSLIIKFLNPEFPH
jgi:hypothetical protein